MVQEVDIDMFAAAHADGALVIDVREPHEYVSGHVPGARLIPLDALRSRGGELPAGRPVYLICASGNRSLTAAWWLTSTGLDARSVAGGTIGWIGAGLPVVTGPAESAA